LCLVPQISHKPLNQLVSSLFKGLIVRAIVHHILRAVATELGAAKRHWNNLDSRTEIPPHSGAKDGRNMTENMVVFTFCWG
jgi:hypothetical protein